MNILAKREEVAASLVAMERQRRVNSFRIKRLLGGHPGAGTQRRPPKGAGRRGTDPDDGDKI